MGDFQGTPGVPRGPAGPWGPAGPVAPTGPAGPAGTGDAGIAFIALCPRRTLRPGGPAGPRNQSQPPELSVITKTENKNIFCMTQSPNSGTASALGLASSFDEEDKMAKDKNLFDE
jgi:hypothetical protein